MTLKSLCESLSQSNPNYFKNAVESIFTLSATLAESTLAESTLAVSVFTESTSFDEFVAELPQDVAKLSATIAIAKNKIFFIVLIKF